MLFPPISSLMQLQKANGRPSRGRKEEKKPMVRNKLRMKVQGEKLPPSLS